MIKKTTKKTMTEKSKVKSPASKKTVVKKTVAQEPTVQKGLTKKAKVKKPAKSIVKKVASATPLSAKFIVQPVAPELSKKEKKKGAGKIHKSVTNREFKVLIKPLGLDRRNRIDELSTKLVKFCKKQGVHFAHLDNVTTGLRTVYFFDTPNEDLRNHNLILRVRESRKDVWIDDWCEVTFKCRAHDVGASLAFNTLPSGKAKSRARFKEEILRGDAIGSQRQIYSNNAILDAVPVDEIFSNSLSSAMTMFPTLNKLGLPKNTPLDIVGGTKNKILEACLPLGNLVFGAGVQAHCEIAIWMRSVGEPIVGELAFSYHIDDKNRKEAKAHKRADKFFNALQIEFVNWIEAGSTKTALVYGKPE
jgi:hypothetical protein